MRNYILRRILNVLLILLIVSVLVFLMIRLIPGDPAKVIAGEHASEKSLAELRAQLGLDKPIYIQFFTWFGKVLSGDFGYSIFTHEPVLKELLYRFPNTFELAVFAMIFATLIGVFAGIISAVKRYSILDYTSMIIALFGVSMPTFWFGLLLIIVFSFNLGWLPSAGSIGVAGFLWWGNSGLDAIAHLILPVIVLVYVSLAQNIRLIRANMLEVLRSDYILAARASGISERKVVYRYALRNAITPAVTFLGISLGGMIAGAPMTEYVFSWPGLGRQYVASTMGLDFPTVMGITMIITVMTLIANLVMDILYVYIDPRVRIR